MRFIFVLLGLSLGACGSPQSLPVAIPSCDAVQSSHRITLTAVVVNKAAKAISGLAVAVDFYRDFRYTRLHGATKFFFALAPGEKRNVSFDIPASPVVMRGRAMRCFATHISYLDGTSQDVTPSH